MKMITKKIEVPGHSCRSCFPAFSLSAALSLGVALAPVSVQAQQSTQPAAQPQPSVQPPASARPTPSQLELSKLIWSTIAAVDHANRSGNYSVLRDLSSQAFQVNNNAAKLAQIFTGLRNSNVDLSNALLVPPTYYEPAQLVRDDVFRVRGLFQLRPVSIGFEMYFQWEQGRWKLFGIDIQPLQMTGQPAQRQ
ncbi:MAG: hypothetical protein AAGK02_09130 [Pseudomonadota bacterium]